MNIPSPPIVPIADRSGNITTAWRIYFEETARLFQTLNLVTYEELTTAQRNAIPSGQRDARMVYDTDLNALFMGANDSFIAI